MVANATPADERRIVVGVDGSEPSIRALTWAGFIASGTVLNPLRGAEPARRCPRAGLR
jgi:nucleotide-binding universal stress UspA family protein